MVDVAHDGDDRRPRREIGIAVLVALRLLVLVCGMLDRELALRGQLGRNQLDLVVGQGLRDRHGLPQTHHEHDDLGRRHSECLREVSDSDARRHGDRPGRSHHLARRLGPRRLAFALLLARVARACSRVVDHDAALASRACAALAGPHRAIWSVRAGFVGHQMLKCRGMPVPDRSGRSSVTCG